MLGNVSRDDWYDKKKCFCFSFVWLLQHSFFLPKMVSWFSMQIFLSKCWHVIFYLINTVWPDRDQHHHQIKSAIKTILQKRRKKACYGTVVLRYCTVLQYGELVVCMDTPTAWGRVRRLSKIPHLQEFLKRRCCGIQSRVPQSLQCAYFNSRGFVCWSFTAHWQPLSFINNS